MDLPHQLSVFFHDDHPFRNCATPGAGVPGLKGNFIVGINFEHFRGENITEPGDERDNDSICLRVVERSAMWQKVPAQGKNCHLGRFLDSLRSLGMTCQEVVLCYPHGLYLPRTRNGTQAVPYGFTGGRYRSTVQVIVETHRPNRKTYVIPTVASAEWRNPPRWMKNQHKIKLATWEDPSTRCRSLGMTCR